VARDSKEQREMKIEALRKAIEELKEASTPSENLVTFQNVVDLANENNADRFERPISLTSIKSPTSEPFKVIKKSIEDHRKEYKENKKSLSSGTKNEIAALKKTIEGLMIEVARFYDDKLIVSEQMEAKDNTIDKLKKQRDMNIKEIEKLKG